MRHTRHTEEIARPQKVSMNKNKERRKTLKVHGNPKYLTSEVIKVSDIL